MAMIRVEPVEVQVRTDWLTARPRRSPGATSGCRSPGSSRSATSGPPIPVDHRARGRCSRSTRPGARLALTYLHRSRRWTIDGARRARAGGLTPPATTHRRRGSSPSTLVGSDCGASATTLAPRATARLTTPRTGPSGSPWRVRASGPEPRTHPLARPLDAGPYNRDVDPSTRFGDLTLATFVDRLASPSPCRVVAAPRRWPAASPPPLVAMVAALSAGPAEVRGARRAPRGGDHRRRVRLADRFLTLPTRTRPHTRAYGAAMKLPRDTDHERQNRAGRDQPGGARRVGCAVPDGAGLRRGRRLRRGAGGPEQPQRELRSRGRGAPQRRRLARGRGERLRQPARDRRRRDVAASCSSRTERLADEIERQADFLKEVVRSGESREPIEVRPE